MDLRAKIREALRESDDPDPRAAIPDIIASIPPDDLPEAFKQALNPLVVQIAGLERMHHRRQQQRAGISWTEAIRDREFVDGQWIFYEDLTPENLDWLAEDCDRRANELIWRAEEWRVLAATMRAAGVQRLGDLEAVPA